MNDALGIHPGAGLMAGSVLLASRGVPYSPAALAGAAIEAKNMALMTIVLEGWVKRT